MSQNVLLNGVVYVIPDVGDDNWGQNLTDYFTAIPSAVLQKSGGAFTLTADVNFGATFGLVSAYFKSRTANIAAAGAVRLARADTVSWRNQANGADLPLAVDSSNRLTFNGSVIPTGSGTFTAGSVIFAGASGVLSQDNANFFWDDSNNRLGIGTTAPTSDVQIQPPTGSGPSTQTMRGFGSGGSPILLLQRAQGTASSPTQTLSGQNLGNVFYGGYANSSAFTSGNVQITGVAGEDFTASAQGSYLTFLTTPLGATSPVEGLRIGTDGRITVAALNATGVVHNSSAGVLSTSLIVDADVASAAAIAVSKLAALTVSRAVVSDGSGFISAATTTATEIGYVNGVTSSIQTQLNAKQASGNYITALTGDGTAAGPGSAALTLATVNSNVGSFGSSTSIPTFTVNAKGLITAASGNVVIAPAGTLTGTTLNSTVVTSSLTAVGTLATGVWNATTISVTKGGTGTTTQFTAGSVAFAGASGVYTQDNANFFWDDSNNRLGIGSATPVSDFHIQPPTGSGACTQTMRGFGAGGSPVVLLQRAQGTASSPTQTQSGQNLGNIFFGGYTNSSAFTSTGCEITGVAGENYTSSAQGSYLTFTVTQLGTTAVVEAVRFDTTGQVKAQILGAGYSVKEGSNAKMGTATLSAGTVVVSTTAVTASSRIFLTVQSLGTVAVATPIAVTARSAGTSFTITSSSVTDTSTVAWILFEPS